MSRKRHVFGTVSLTQNEDPQREPLSPCACGTETLVLW